MLTTLILTTLVSVNSQANTTCTTNALGDRTCTTVTAGTTTGNVLTNSTFGTGNTTTTTGWSSDGHKHTHANFGNFPYQSGMDTSGGVWAGEGHTDDNIYQDVDLVGDGHLTKSQINEGFTSTQSADVWFWNNIENDFTLKQTITASDGTVTTQIRVINDHNPSRPFNGGTFQNYTNVYTESANSQNDYTIRAEMYNETAGTAYDNTHRGPDVDNVQLSITTAGTTTVVVTPCFVLGTCTTIGDDIDDAVNLETEDGIDLFDDIDTRVEDAIQEFEDSQFTDSFDFDTGIEILVEDDIGNVEFIPLEIYVEESFNDFLEDNNLVDTFQQELVFEEITEEEFYEELTDVVGAEFESLMAPMPMPNEPGMETDSFYMTETEMDTFIEENPDMIEYADENVVMLKPPSDLENYDETVMPGQPNEETMIEEPEMMEEEFTDGPPRMTEIKEEPEMKEEEISNEPEIVETREEEPKEEEVKEAKEEVMETESDANTETTTKTEDTSKETMETSEDRETNNEESTMAEDKETERSETETDSEENMDDKTISNTEKAAIKDRSISIKVKKIIAKLEKTLLDVQDKVKAVQLITLKGMTSQGANLNTYNFQLKDTIKLDDGNPDFFNQLNIGQEQIYTNKSLNAYTNNDPISIKQSELIRIDIEKKQLLLELKLLREG